MVSPTHQRLTALFEGRDWDREPGCAAAVMQGEAVAWRGAFGLAHLGAGTPITSTTRFRICSITKLLFALCAARLEAEGAWDLDAPVTIHVPELRVAQTPTLRQLLAMQSGLCETYPLEWLGLGGAAAGVALDQLLALHLRQSHQSFAPGARTLYANANYMLLQLAAERVTGLACGAMLQDMVFGPAGMVSSLLADGIACRLPNAATAYAVSGDGFVVADPDVATGAAGGCVSTLDDMVALVRWLRAEPYDWRRRLATPPPHLDGTSSSYACGVGRQVLAGREVLGHSGGIAGWLCEFLWCPEADTAAIVLGNRADQNWLERGRELLVTTWDAPPDPAMTPRLLPGAAPAPAWSRTYATEDRSTSINVEGAGDELLVEGRRFPPQGDGRYARNLGVEPITLRPLGGIESPPPRLRRTEGNVEQVFVLAHDETAPSDRRILGDYGRADLPQPLRVYEDAGGQTLLRAGAAWPAAEPMALRHVLGGLYRVYSLAGVPQETHLRFEFDGEGPATAATLFFARILDYRLNRLSRAQDHPNGSTPHAPAFIGWTP